MNIGRNMDEIVRSVKALQTADGEGVAPSAGWQKNELVGDLSIVPAPSSEADTQKRLEAAETGDIECYDWLLRHGRIQ